MESIKKYKQRIIVVVVALLVLVLIAILLVKRAPTSDNSDNSLTAAERRELINKLEAGGQTKVLTDKEKQALILQLEKNNGGQTELTPEQKTELINRLNSQ